MNSDILDLNYKQQSMLEINNDIIIADNWDILDRSKYKVIGQLIFNINQQKNTNAFGLKIFTFSDHEINWD